MEPRIRSSFPAAAPQQGSHHYVITLEWPTGPNGKGSFTADGTITPSPGATRSDLYLHIRRFLAEQRPNIPVESANTIFFALEPNQL